MEIKNIPLSQLKPYPNNAKKHPPEQVEHIANSLKQFGWKQPLVIDKNNVVVVGHGRLFGAKKLGLETAPCIIADDLTEDEIKAYRLADNKLNESEWDFELLDFELGEIDLDMSEFGFDLGFDDELVEVEHRTLVENFVVPPFSVLDTRQGYWQDRKRQWNGIGIISGNGRNDNLFNNQDGDKYEYIQAKGVAVQTSVFDPVLAEIMYKWFCIDNGTIYDCFAGGSVRGIVAEKLGYKYKGIDVRQEQIDENIRQAKELMVYPQYYCDDSLNANKYIDDDSVDMVFTCPPYADLEVYSDDARDISNMDYNDFCRTFKNILSIACRKLKDDRFVVIVISDVRDKKGAYRQLVDYTRKCLTDNGLVLYNDIILIEPIGTGAIRAKRTFNSLRKCIKVHQNVLVFYKGNIKRIKDNYKKLDIRNDLMERE